jgi:hypothetical protein
MKRAIFMGTCLVLLLVTGLSWPGNQLPQQAVAKKIFPHISSVTQSFDYGLANYLIVNGMHFPPKTADNNIRRNIRLVTMGGAGSAKGYVFYLGETGNWTSTRIDDFVPMEVLAGRKYKVGLVEFTAPGPNVKKLISNEVEFFLLMKLETITPNPVPHGTTEIEVTTTNNLGPQGSRIVKIGGQTAVVTQWGGSGTKFKFGIPHGLVIPGIYELNVEDNGGAVSNKVQVRLLAAKGDLNG